MSGYTVSVAIPTDLSKVWPNFVAGTMDVQAVIDDASAEVRRDVQKRCSAEGHDLTQILAPSVFVKAETYLALAKICEANLNPRDIADTLGAAAHWRKRYVEELASVVWEYDQDVDMPDEDHEQEEGTGPVFVRC
jgi:hypothetical protein